MPGVHRPRTRRPEAYPPPGRHRADALPAATPADSRATHQPMTATRQHTTTPLAATAPIQNAAACLLRSGCSRNPCRCCPTLVLPRFATSRCSATLKGANELARLEPGVSAGR
jgi:hypothetical protein